MTVPFDNARRGLEAVGASVRDRELVELLIRHGQEEGQILDRYNRFVTEAHSAAARYLVQLIIADEERHHRVMVELANAVAWGWSELSPQPAVPDLPVSTRAASDLVAETHRLLAAEKQDRKELQKLHKEFAAYSEYTLWDLLVDVMLLDTEKHMHILSFIEKHDLD